MPPGVFLGNASVDTDFIRVDIVTSSGETNSDVHMHVFPKKEVIDREQKPGGIPLNVALIMFDSTSAANFRRKMPNSLKYLTKSLNSILLQGERFGFLYLFTEHYIVCRLLINLLVKTHYHACVNSFLCLVQ